MTIRSLIWRMRLADPDLQFRAVRRTWSLTGLHQRTIAWCWGQRVEAGPDGPQSPVLVWRNVTRVKLIQGLPVGAYHAPPDELLPGEPLICDGIELPVKHRKKRLDLEARGLIKGAQVDLPGCPAQTPPAFQPPACDRRGGPASLGRVDRKDRDCRTRKSRLFPIAARMGATFLHGAAVTIHKAQGSPVGNRAGLCAGSLGSSARWAG